MKLLGKDDGTQSQITQAKKSIPSNAAYIKDGVWIAENGAPIPRSLALVDQTSLPATPWTFYHIDAAVLFAFCSAISQEQEGHVTKHDHRLASPRTKMALEEMEPNPNLNPNPNPNPNPN